MKNVLPDFMSKTGKTPLKLTEEDLVTISYLAAKIAAKLQQIKKTYSNPKKYSEKVLKLLEHNKNMATAFIVLNSNDMDPFRLYKPSEIKNEMNKRMLMNITDDTTNLVASLSKNSISDTGDYLTSKDVSKALKTLEKEIELIKVDSKEKVKGIKGKQKVEFLGKPYFYKLPLESDSLKRIIDNPRAVEIIFKILMKMNLLPLLKFILEASIYAVRDSGRKRRMYELTKIAIKQIGKPSVEVDESKWESYRDLMLSISEDQLKTIVDKIAETTATQPALYRFILLLSLSKSS